MSYPNHQIDLQLQRERQDRIRHEFEAEDHGEFDAAIERLEREEATERRAKMDSSLLMTAGCGGKSEKKNGIRI